ncbi:hypothetical protein E2C00_25280 [Streptomyces sp. WAC05374]|uniref:hypothetical protein n=1 Tax=unclassified Streptomyces TaxID=2593676 RepID=UPI001056345A|nr:hypothetical protein [Streptomyces sp. WAC05374]TDF43762.1 hypothetical protein E2B92_17500 [Streptomyces sp. WAC05374]TDF52069.1 hypothetical protein E2C00_25280 [Streptomyces sp. WAC05374]TDF54425.1 hypothetical protein E2C02_17675 [Streptomyces sp. WAC05374]
MTGAVITIAIILIIAGGSTLSVVAYFRLQRHRADAVAMASYRRLAEEAGAGHEALRRQLGALDARLESIETLLRSVG